MLKGIVEYLRLTRKTLAHNLQKYIRSRVDGPSRRQTGENGVGEKLVYLIMYCRKKAMTFPVWVLFLNLCDKTPMFLRYIAYYKLNVIQSMIPRTNANHSRNPYQGILSRTISTVVLMDMKNFPMIPLFHWDLPIYIVLTL